MPSRRSTEAFVARLAHVRRREAAAASDRPRTRDRHAGRRVQLQRAADWHRGTVTLLDTSTQRHLIGFDNGDVEWHVSCESNRLWFTRTSLEACTHYCMLAACTQVLP